MRSLVLLIFIVLTATVSPAMASHLGSVGTVYPILEIDALTEIRAAADKVNWSAVMNRDKMRERIKNFVPDDVRPLPTARENKTFTVDMTYTLDTDIPDGKGGILYPKGYSFNPLDYLNMSSILVVINGDSQRQVEWFKSSEYADDYRTRLLLSNGGYYDLSQELDRPVFYLQGNIAKRLQLAAVPSVVWQSGRVLAVREVDLDE